jgi:hypothetical protein
MTLGSEHFQEVYEEILNRNPDMEIQDAIEATKIAIYYEISRDWLAVANREIH